MYYVLHSTIPFSIFDLSKQKNKTMKTSTAIHFKTATTVATDLTNNVEPKQAHASKKALSAGDLWKIQKNLKSAFSKRNFN